jgi:hypothetical protein
VNIYQILLTAVLATSLMAQTLTITVTDDRGRVLLTTTTAPSPRPASVAKPLGDYVPCLFDRDQDASLQGQRTSRRQVERTLDEWEGLGYLSARAAQQKPLLATALSNHSSDDFAAMLDQMNASGLLNLPAPVTTNTLAANLKSATDAIFQGLPRDVACSQSVLSWTEARDAYNQRIANTYLVYQVNVRNLNPQSEFLMQDVQVAVAGHEFVAGRDKIIARGVALQGQAYSRRNTLERVLQAIATLGLAMTGVVSAQAFREGVSIFAAGVVPGFSAVLPDRSDDQMTRFNDTSFSASQPYKIVVPKSGSVTFVTYLPFRIFAEGKSTKRWTLAQWTHLADSTCVIIAGVHITEQ